MQRKNVFLRVEQLESRECPAGINPVIPINPAIPIQLNAVMNVTPPPPPHMQAINIPSNLASGRRSPARARR